MARNPGNLQNWVDAGWILVHSGQIRCISGYFLLFLAISESSESSQSSELDRFWYILVNSWLGLSNILLYLAISSYILLFLAISGYFWLFLAISESSESSQCSEL